MHTGGLITVAQVWFHISVWVCSQRWGVFQGIDFNFCVSLTERKQYLCSNTNQPFASRSCLTALRPLFPTNTGSLLEHNHCPLPSSSSSSYRRTNNNNYFPFLSADIPKKTIKLSNHRKAQNPFTFYVRIHSKQDWCEKRLVYASMESVCGRLPCSSRTQLKGPIYIG